MEIYKAIAMEQYAQLRGLASLRYDQSSCGQASGVTREEVSTDIWMRDALSIVDEVAQAGPVILVASSNGGWISTYIATVRPERIAGLVLIGPSFKFPHLRYDELIGNGTISKEMQELYNQGHSWKTPYGEAYFSRKDVEESRRYGIKFEDGIKINCPVRVLHAFPDEDVEWQSSLRFLRSLDSSEVDLIIRKSGNHRLMKPKDLTLLTFTLDRLIQEHFCEQSVSASEAIEKKMSKL